MVNNAVLNLAQVGFKSRASLQEGYEWLDTPTSKELAVTAFDTAPSFYYQDLQGKGTILTQGGESKLFAGGFWTGGAACGSRGRNADSGRWATNANRSSRGCSPGIFTQG